MPPPCSAFVTVLLYLYNEIYHYVIHSIYQVTITFDTKDVLFRNTKLEVLNS